MPNSRKYRFARGSVSRFACVSVPAALLLVGVPASGFAPDWFKNLVGGGGRSHLNITEDAILSILRREYGINDAKDSVGRAIDRINEANSAVDDDQTRSAKHFDGENFEGGHSMIIEHRRRVVAALRAGNVSQAQKDFGTLLHPLQDFYTHSNWRELGNGAPLRMLSEPTDAAAALADWASRKAAPTEATCRDCELVIAAPFCGGCENNLVTTKLTSGYYGGEDRALPATPYKCSHGGITDTTAPPGGLTSGWGINKDNDACVAAPHEHLHPAAADLAQQATEAILLSLRTEVGEAQFRQLLGLGPSLAVVMDTTNSMGPIIDQVRDQAIELVEQREDTDQEPTRYLLVPFKDPQIGPMVTTPEGDTFIEALEELTAGGGGDCPEPVMRALDAAVSIGDEGSSVYVYTNAAAKDASFAPSVYSLAALKQITIFFGLFGSCSPYSEEYFQVAEETGGQVFTLSEGEAGSVAALANASARGDTDRLLNASVELSGTEVTRNLVVDPSIQELIISFSATTTARDPLTPEMLATLPTLSVVTPSGETLTASSAGATITTLSGGALVRVPTPAPGVWSLRLAGAGKTRLVATALTSLRAASFRFVVPAGRPGHEGFSPRVGSPLGGEETQGLLRMSGSYGSVALELRDLLGNPLGSAVLEPTANGTGAYFATLTPPRGSFIVRVSGTDSNGNPFEREIEQVFHGQDLELVAPRDRDIEPGSQLTERFVLENRGPADTFRVIVTDTGEFVADADPFELTLAEGEVRSVEVQLEVSDESPLFSGSTVSLSVQSTSDPRLFTAGAFDVTVARAETDDEDLVPTDQDNCPELANTDQIDTDGDAQGDACDGDDDGDGRPDVEDSCPLIQNSSQSDEDEDGQGDECDPDPNCACRMPGVPTSYAPAGAALVLSVAGLLGLRRRMRRKGLASSGRGQERDGREP